MKLIVDDKGVLKVEREPKTKCSVMEAANRVQDEVKGYHKYTMMGETYKEEAHQEYCHGLRAMKDLIMCFYDMSKTEEQQEMYIKTLAEAVKCIDPAQVEAIANTPHVA